MLKYLLILILFITSCSNDPVIATFEGKVIDKQWRRSSANNNDAFIIFFIDKEINEVIRVDVSHSLYYTTSIGSTIAFKLTAYNLRLYKNGSLEDCEKLINRKTLKSGREYLKKQK